MHQFNCDLDAERFKFRIKDGKVGTCNYLSPIYGCMEHLSRGFWFHEKPLRAEAPMIWTLRDWCTGPRTNKGVMPWATYLEGLGG